MSQTNSTKNLTIMITMIVIAAAAFSFIVLVIPRVQPPATTSLPINIEQKKFQSQVISEPVVTLDLSTFNGYVIIKPSDTKRVSINATMKGTQTQLEKVTFDFKEETKDQMQTITLRVDRTDYLFSNAASVSLDVLTPSDRTYYVKVETSNGLIEISSLKGEKLTVNTSNGQIRLTNANFGIIDATTTNGRIIGQDISANKATLTTSNGGINAIISNFGSYKLSTSNGQIDVDVRHQAPVRLEVRTSNGRIEWSGPPLTTSQSSKDQLSGYTTDFDVNKPNVDLQLTSSNDNIYITYYGKD